MANTISSPERHKYTTPEIRVVVFKLAGQEYVVEVARVQEIIRPTDIKPMAGAPAYVEGLIKLHGRIVPIADLRKCLHLPLGLDTPETCILITRLTAGLIGFIVDSASELLWVKTRAFEVPSPILAGTHQPHVQGIAHIEGRVLILLNVDQVLTEPLVGDHV